MTDILIIVDPQVDFATGALGTKEAAIALENAAEYIKNFNGKIYVTLDTHYDDYLDTNEGKNLPVPHCKRKTPGWEIYPAIKNALKGKQYTVIEKNTFGSIELPNVIRKDIGDEKEKNIKIKFIGLCTDICVINNALIMRAQFPEADIEAYENYMAGVTPETHKAAITVMKSCQINIV